MVAPREGAMDGQWEPADKGYLTGNKCCTATLEANGPISKDVKKEKDEGCFGAYA